MFRVGTGIFSDKIHLKTIDYLNHLLDFNMKNVPETEYPSCTKNGYQTANIITYLNDSYKKELLKKHFNIKDLHHVHLIHYYSNGYQELHHHEQTEKYSFVVYLNDADGDTVVYLKNNKEYRITPKKGKIVYFPGHLLHEGLLSTTNKRVAVGSLQRK